MATGLQGKRAIVTGGASGIGRGVVDRFLSDGAKVAALDINVDGLAACESEHADEPLGCFVVDVSRRSEVESQLGAAISWLGGCDILVNSAGITSSGDALDLAEEEFDRVMDVNVKGSFLCAQVAGRAMRDGGGGAIVNISSVSAELANPHHVHYSTSKGAVRMLTKALAVALSQYNIRVNAVGPGPIMTAMGKSEMGRSDEHRERLVGRVLRGRHGTPDDVAAAVAFLASDEADYIDGTTLYVDGGVLAVR